MDIKYSLIFSTITMTTLLFGMELDVPRRSKSQLSRFKINWGNHQQAFASLTEDKACFLKMFLAEEQRGEPSSFIGKAEKLLRTLIKPGESGHTRIDAQIKGIYDQLDQKTKDLLILVSCKADHRRYLISELNRYEKYDLLDNCLSVCRKIIEHNRYVVNAYGSDTPYGDRTITPLQHILIQTADGLLPKKIGKRFCEFLLSCRANPNAGDDKDNTCLHYAPTPGFISLLCSYGAKPGIKGDLGRTSLLNHIGLRNWSTVKQLLPYCSYKDMNKQDSEGNTPLHEAVQAEKNEIVQLLLEAGANWGTYNNKKQLPRDLTTNPAIHMIIQNHIVKNARCIY